MKWKYLFWSKSQVYWLYCKFTSQFQVLFYCFFLFNYPCFGPISDIHTSNYMRLLWRKSLHSYPFMQCWWKLKNYIFILWKLFLMRHSMEQNKHMILRKEEVNGTAHFHVGKRRIITGWWVWKVDKMTKGWFIDKKTFLWMKQCPCLLLAGGPNKCSM